jgi:hypothetical protein
MQKQVICEHDRHHGFTDGHCPDSNAGIMPPLG